MEKILDINGQNVKFRADGSIPVRYMAEFQKDFFSEIVKFEKALTGDVSNLDTQFMYQMSYIMAKMADKELPPMLDWLVSFEEGFPVLDVFTELQDMMTANLSTMKKAKKK